MNIIKFILGLFKSKPDFIHGVVENDPILLSRQPQFEEMVAKARPVDWKPLDVSKLPDYPVRNQNGASACVAFTIALICSILYFLRTGVWINFSAAWIYSRRGE
jgi:hypothetical protein